MRFGHLQYRSSHRCQSGYMLIVLIFLMTAIMIGLVVTLPAIKASVQREREQEMIHRGVQYSRAVKKYYKKFGRYPANLEALEDTNHMRFLRKRYKDPFTEKGEWQLVRFGQVQFDAAQRQGGSGAQASGQPGLPNITGVTPMLQGSSPSQQPMGAGGTTGSFGQSSVGGSFSQSNVGGSFSNQGNSTGSSGSSFGTPVSQMGQQSTSGTSGQSQVGGTFSMSTTGGGNQPLGGGGIIGVASTSPRESLKIVADKNHYKDWKFVYDPTLDANNGALITGPYDPKKALGKFANAAGGLGKPIGQNIGTPIGQPAGGVGSGSSSGSGFGQPTQPPDQNAPPPNPQ